VKTRFQAFAFKWVNLYRYAWAIKREMEKTATGKGPLAEIDFWRDRNAALSSLFEQLNLPNVRRMIEVIESATNVDASVMSGFKVQFAELTKLYVETKDNVKFLTTLERHFKNITNYKSMANGSLSTIADTLAPMLNALRMVWLVQVEYS
jgi:dynein heavy chain